MHCFPFILRRLSLTLLFLALAIPAPVHALTAPVTPAPNNEDMQPGKLTSLNELSFFFAEAEKKGISNVQAALLLRDFALVLGSGGDASTIKALEHRNAGTLAILFGRNSIIEELRVFSEDAAHLVVEKLTEDALADRTRPIETVLTEAFTETLQKTKHQPLANDLNRYGLTPDSVIALLKRLETVLDPEKKWRIILNQKIDRLMQEIRKRQSANKITKVASDRASDIYITFSRPFDFNALRQAWLDKDLLLEVTSRGKSIPVQHLAQESSRVLRIGFAQDRAPEESALITAGIRDLRQNPAFAVSYASFVLKDAKLPALKSTQQTGSGSFLLEFDEPIYTGTRNAGFEFWKMNGHEIYGRLTQAKPETAESRLSGDFRRFAVLELNYEGRSRYLPPGEMNKLEGFGIADYAGQRTGRRLHGVEITFASPKLTEPMPEFSMQSPEQFALHFPSETVSLHGWGFPLQNEAIRFERQNGWDENGNPKWTTERVRLIEDIAIEHEGFLTYYLHLKKDWSCILQGEDGAPSYDSPGHNRIRITLLGGKAKDLGSGMTNQTDIMQEFTLTADTQPPRIAKIAPAFSAIPGQETIEVTFDEPVQIPGATKYLTPSIKESSVPSPVFEFVSPKSGARIPTSVIGFITAKDDMTYTLALPDEVARHPGSWELLVRNLSDDVGNKNNTQTYSITIGESVLRASKHLELPALVWGTAIDNVNADQTPEAEEDVIVLQFNTILSKDAIAREKYWIAGKQLPSTAKILAQPIRFDTDKDGAITDKDGSGTRLAMLLPKDTFGVQDSTVIAESVSGVHFNVQVENEEGQKINKWGSLPYSQSGTPDAIPEEVLTRYRKTEASPSDYAWLQEAIQHAEAELSASHAGDMEGEFPTESIKTLRKTIIQAKQTAGKKRAARGEIDEAIHSLHTVQTSFYASQHALPADKWELITQLRIATFEWEEIKENPYQYPPTLRDAFAEAITHAETVIANENATEQEIRDAYRRLVDVINEKARYDDPYPH